MSTTPIIQSTGSTSGAGTAGQGRNDLVSGETVTLSDAEPTNTGATYLWTLEDRPIGSTAVLSSATSPTPTYVADVSGSYRVKCVVDSNFTAEEVHSVPLPNTNARIPSFGERTQYDGAGNLKGWHQALDSFMRQADSLLGSVGTDEKVKVSFNDTTSNFLFQKLVAGSAIALAELNDAADEDVQVSVANLTDVEVAAANKDGLAGTASMRTLGTGAQQSCAGNDSRLSDARTPTAHVVSHQNGGGDQLNVNGLSGVLADNQKSDTVHETGGPTDMVVGAVADGQYLRRSGSTVIGSTIFFPDTSTVIHYDAANEINLAPEKVSPVSADLLIIEDSASANAKKKVQIGNLPGGGGTDANAIHDNTAGEIAAVTEKVSPVSADLLIIEDSASANAKKKVQIGNLPGGSGTAGSLEFVDRIVVGGTAVSAVTFGAGGDGIFGTALDGDSDDLYVCYYNVTQVDITATDYRIRPNQLNAVVDFGAALATSGIATSGSGGFTGVTRGNLVFVGGNTRHQLAGELQFWASTQQSRQGRVFRNDYVNCALPPNIGTTVKGISSGVWDEVSTNLTSLKIETTNQASETARSAIGPGSVFNLFKLRKTPSAGVGVTGVGGLEYVDTIEVTGAAATDVTFGTGGDGILGTALDGDVDEVYMLEWHVPGALASPMKLQLQPNAIGTNQLGALNYAGTTSGGLTTTWLELLNGAGGSTAISFGNGLFFAKTGQERTWIATEGKKDALSNVWSESVSGFWSDTTTKVTSLRLHSTVASGIPIGSRFVLYKRVRTNAIVAKTVLSAPASTIGVTGLDGDTDGEYEVELNLVATGFLSNDIDIRPNGSVLTDRQTTRRFDGTTYASNTGVVAANGTTSSEVMRFKGTIRCKASRGGFHRMFLTDVMLSWNVSSIGRWEAWTNYSDDTANLTSLSLGITNVQFAAGSEMTVRRITK